MPITFSRADHWVHLPEPSSYLLVVAPVVDRVLLSKVLIDGGSALNIIFTNTLNDMGFNYEKLMRAEDPFFGIVPGMASYPVGRVVLPVTFGTEANYRTEWIHFEVADFKSSYHAIFKNRNSLVASPHKTKRQQSSFLLLSIYP
ncbi:unnamed protein product [Urochloa humidicola]